MTAINELRTVLGEEQGYETKLEVRKLGEGE